MPAFSSEERQLLDDSLRDLLADKYPTSTSRRSRAADGDGFGREDWATYAEMGWLGIALPGPPAAPAAARRSSAS